MEANHDRPQGSAAPPIFWQKSVPPLPAHAAAAPSLTAIALPLRAWSCRSAVRGDAVSLRSSNHAMEIIMATQHPKERLDLDEQIIRIEKLIVDVQNTRQTMRLEPWKLMATGITSGAALFAAAAAFTKLLM
jgi:hypothetical protein